MSAGIDGGLVVPPRRPPLSATSAARARHPAGAGGRPGADPGHGTGRLPAIAADGRLPRDIYARPHERGDERAKLVIIVVGIGLNSAASEAAIERLPGAVVLAIDAYADRPDEWARAARRSGHEILATVPMGGGPPFT